MAIDVELISQRSVLNRPVLDRDTRKEIAQVDVLWAYPPAHRVYGFIGKTGLLGRTKLAFKLPQVESVGGDGVVVVGAPEPTQADKVRQLPSLINAEVWSERGDRLGKLVDYRFDRHTGMIAHYLFVAGDWAGIGGDLYRLPPRKIARLEDQRIWVPDVSVAKLKIDQEGFQHIFEEAGDILLETYSDVQRELRGLTRRTQRLTEQAKETFENITEQAKEKAVGVTEQLRDETQAFSEQANETRQTVTERVKERAQTLAEQAKEVSQTLVERLNETEAEDPKPSDLPQTDSPAAVDPFSVSPFEDQPTVSTPVEALDDGWDLDDDDEWELAEPPSSGNPDPATPDPPPTAAPTARPKALADDDDDDEPWI